MLWFLIIFAIASTVERRKVSFFFLIAILDEILHIQDASVVTCMDLYHAMKVTVSLKEDR